MIESDKTATMEQVARAAGVSIGTVDRVLHNREGVSEKTRKKVFDVINEIGYNQIYTPQYCRVGRTSPSSPSFPISRPESIGSWFITALRGPSNSRRD